MATDNTYCTLELFLRFVSFLTTVVVFNYSGGGGGGGDVYGRINRAPGCRRTKNSFAVLSRLWESAKLLTFKKVSLNKTLQVKK